MGSFTNYAENKILNELGNNLIVATASLWVGLFTTIPSDASGGVECTGGDYARRPAGAWTTCAGAGTIANAASITFITCSVAWGTASAFAVFDASTTAVGNMIAWGQLTAAKTIGTADVAQFGIGSLTISLD